MTVGFKTQVAIVSASVVIAVGSLLAVNSVVHLGPTVPVPTATVAQLPAQAVTVGSDSAEEASDVLGAQAIVAEQAQELAAAQAAAAALAAQQAAAAQAAAAQAAAQAAQKAVAVKTVTPPAKRVQVAPSAPAVVPVPVTKCPAGTVAGAVDANGNESNCQAENASGEVCTAYSDANVCIGWSKE